MKRFINWLSDLQIRRPYFPIAAVVAVTVVFALFAARLELRTRYDALLPDKQPSVVELHRVAEHATSAQVVMILLEGPDRAALRAMGDAVVPKLLALGPEIISSAEDGTAEARAFLAPRAGLFLDTKEVQGLHDDIKAYWDYEVAKAQGTLLEDSGPPVDLAAIEKRFEKRTSELGGDESQRGGYYERKDGTALVVIARSPIVGGDLAKTGPALAKVKAAVEQAKAERPEFSGIRVGYAGDMPQGFAEYDRIRGDLLDVGASGLALVLLAVLLYFMRLRALFVMGVTILVALVWTFGLTQLVIGHLNVATSFLVSIVAGNGINVGILYQSRYFEERDRGADVHTALRSAVHATWQPTIIAALASAASYVSLLITDFRAFQHFGFIAATGMVVCWVVKTLMVPPLLLLTERWPGIDTSSKKGPAWLRAMRNFGLGYGRIFAWVVPRAPRLLLGTGVVVTLLGAVATVRYIQQDPMEYDLSATENDPQHNSELDRAWSGVFSVLGPGHDGMIVLADAPEDARELEKILRAQVNPSLASGKPFAAVHSLWDVIPEDQEAKVPLLREIGKLLERARTKGLIDDARWSRIKDLVPPPDLKPFSLADLPDSLARPYSEKDGTRGRLVAIEPHAGNSNDLRYLLRYSDGFRETRLASGKVVRGSGRAVIFADVLKAVVHDIPRAVALSLGLTLIAVLVTFRRGGYHALSVLFALATGVAGEVLVLYATHVRINFLNFVALPVTFGIGVDYAVNVVQRYRADGSRDILAALRTTGGAVVLCSLTTILGYLALLRSHNRAIRSLGTIAVVGEVTCLLAAVLVLPALWYLVERRRHIPTQSALAVEGEPPR